MRRFRLLSTVLLALAAACLLGSCGVKAPPLPADMLLPEAVTALNYSFNEGGELVITFRPPTRSVQGVALKDLAGFYIDRSENRIRPEFCPNCPVEYTRRFQIRAVEPPARSLVAEVTYTFTDVLRPGYSYSYRVLGHDSDGEFHPGKARTLVVNYDSPVNGPDALRLMSEDRLAVLEWSQPDTLADGRPASDISGYNIYRREGKGGWIRLNMGGPWPEPSYRDTTVRNGVDYAYKVRTVRKWSGTDIEGPPSPAAAVTPADLTPPPTPVNLGAVSLAKGISLSWDEVATPDLAGYRIYRRMDQETSFEKIGPELSPSTTFLDVAVKTGRTYHYYITAVDKSAAANESAPSREAVLTYQP